MKKESTKLHFSIFVHKERDRYCYYIPSVIVKFDFIPEIVSLKNLIYPIFIFSWLVSETLKMKYDCKDVI